MRKQTKAAERAAAAQRALDERRRRAAGYLLGAIALREVMATWNDLRGETATAKLEHAAAMMEALATDLLTGRV